MAPEASTVSTTPAPVSQSTFVSKVTTLPIVTSALDLAKFYYDETKVRFVVVGQVEKEIVERVVPQVVSATVKVTPQSAQAIVSLGLSQLDHYATSGLEILEKNVPLIKEPTPRIIESVIQPVDQLVERALDFSEQKVGAFFPSEKPTVVEGEQEVKKPRLDNFTRAHNLGLALSHGITQKTLQQFELVKKATPHEIQVFLSIDLIRLISATIEKQAAWIKENIHHLAQHLNKEEFNHLLKHFETQITELRAHFTSAIASLEKVTPACLKENTQAIYATLSKSILDFVEKNKDILSTVSLNPASVNDPYLKKLLETLNASISQIQAYAYSLTQSNVFQAFVLKLTAPAAPKEEEKPAEEAEQKEL